MDIPRFDQHLNGSASNVGDAFQQFAYDLLLYDYPDLHFFQAAGVDGGIDLVQTKDGSRLVVECKYIGTDGVSEALSRWRKVEDNLGRNLISAAGPSEAQYAPWYTLDPVITEYVFCISSELNYLGQQDKLREKIAGFFADLSARHAHLAHLSKITVTILDWNDLKARLQKRPHLIFRWFKLLRDYGLATLDETADRTTFRSYLYSDKLPYYSRGDHLNVVPPPAGVDITDEDGLLGRVAGDTLTGLILTGGGGVGKTRLMLEIGYRAQSSGWTVLRVLRRLKEDALEHLARWVTPETKVLLLIDYVETQRDFMELVDVLNNLNDSLGLHLRYVANCRTSYYKTIAVISRHEEFDLSPSLEDPSTVQWFESYLHQTVHHILEHSGIKVTTRHLKVCRDIPVFAVFISYLHSADRQPELNSLLAEEDFSRWIVKRLQLSFGNATISPVLAQLVALLPMSSDATHHYELKEHRVFFDILATDGWIEKLSVDETYEAETWVIAHDVLADQILLSHLKSIPHTIEIFIHELFSLSRVIGCLSSVLLTLERLINKPELSSLDWSKVISKEADKELVQESIKVRIIDNKSSPLVKHIYSALREAGKETLISEIEEATVIRHTTTAHIQERHPVEIELAWLSEHKAAKDAVHSYVNWLSEGRDTELVRDMIFTWLNEYMATVEASYVYTSWLDAGGDIELVRDALTVWLTEHKTEDEARFVYKAWLDASGERELVRDAVGAWLTEHGIIPEASFVYVSWLDAGGDLDLIRTPLGAWLGTQGTEAEASFVYRAWLDAGGDTELVREPLMDWLAKHGTIPEARLVYQPWLNASGDKELIRESLQGWLNDYAASAGADFIFKAWLQQAGAFSAIRTHAIEWLSHNYDKEEATFITKFLAKQPDIPVETVRDILRWCSIFSSNEDALWRLTQLSKHLLNGEVAEEVWAASAAVLNHSLATNAVLRPLVRGQIATLFSYLIDAPNLLTGRLRRNVDELLLRWLRHPASYGDDPKPHPNIERTSYVQRIAHLIDSGALSVTADHEPLTRFLRWVNNWQPEKKEPLRPLLARLEN